MPDIDVSGPLPSIEELEDQFFAKQLAALEGRRDAAVVKARTDADWSARVGRGVDDLHRMQNHARSAEWGGLVSKAFITWIRDGRPLEIPNADGTVSKAALVEDAAGEYLIPTPIEIDILNRARDAGTLRSLADVRPTIYSKQRATLLSAAATGWGKPEVTGSAPVDANVVPSAASPDPIPIYDLVSLALIGVDELSDAPESAQASIVDAIGVAIADAEDAAFANGTGSGQPSGLALAANVTLVPAGQKVAVGASNTPTWAQLQTVPWLLPTRLRNRAVWLMHPTSAQKVAALTAGTGEGLVWPNPGPNGPGLLGWPAHVIDGLPDPATAGTGDASIWFCDVKSAYRVVDRQRTTVQVLRQRYAEQGKVGLVVRHRVGGDTVRHDACAIYTQ